MNSKNIFKRVLFLLVVGFAANSLAQSVDNSVKYGEKYFCMIATADEKKFTLNIDWVSEASKFSKFPEWEESLKYDLLENTVSVDQMSFKDKGQNRNRADLMFSANKFVFSGSESFSSGVATNTFYIDIELSQSYNEKGQRILALTKFSSSHWYEKYVLKKIKETELVVASSTCTVNIDNIQ